MKKYILISFVIVFIVIMVIISHNAHNNINRSKHIIIKLPTPRYNSNISIEKALLARRSVRSYKNEPFSLAELSQILWAAQGITGDYGFRTAPSPGALYPIEIYIATGNVTDIKNGVYKYMPHEHELKLMFEGDKRSHLASAALGQDCINSGAAVIVISAIYERVTKKYMERGIRYTHIEIGHVAQNIYLQSVSLNLGTVDVGAFYDKEVKRVMRMKDNEEPLLIMPVGKK